MTDERSPEGHAWIVRVVQDPDGMGGDFGYTVGLHDLGRPELWMAARPALGEDPGLDWKFSASDVGGLLNEFAPDWLLGRLSVGEEFERSFDAGLVTVRFRVDPPGDREVLEAFGTTPDAVVVPIRWSLDRPVAGGDPRPMSEEARNDAASEFVHLRSRLRGASQAPEGWELPDEPDWSEDGRYGPRTPLVLARAALLWSCGPDAALNLIDAAQDVHLQQRLSPPGAAARTAAAAAGRLAACDRLLEDLPGLVAACLPTVMQGWSSVYGEPDRASAANVESMVFDLMRTSLLVELAADLLPDDRVQAGLGPLTNGWLPPGVPAHPRWVAADEVNEAVDSLLREIAPAGIPALLQAIDASGDDDSDELFYLGTVLRTLNLTTPTCWETRTTSSMDEHLQELGLTTDQEGYWALLRVIEWASNVAAILTYRAEFPAEAVDAFARPYQQVLPDLLHRLNTPV